MAEPTEKPSPNSSTPAAASTRQPGRPTPRLLAHEAVEHRFDRYDLTSGYNQVINRRQFGRGPFADLFAGDWVRPQTTYATTLDVEVGSASMQLIHAQGETDDHTLVWMPQERALFVGDLFIWVFPNAGNPQKVQRYPAEWAAQAAPNDPSVRDTRAEVYRRRRAVEQSLMARGIYNDAAHP